MIERMRASVDGAVESVPTNLKLIGFIYGIFFGITLIASCFDYTWTVYALSTDNLSRLFFNMIMVLCFAFSLDVIFNFIFGDFEYVEVEVEDTK